MLSDAVLTLTDSPYEKVVRKPEIRFSDDLFPFKQGKPFA